MMLVKNLRKGLECKTEVRYIYLYTGVQKHQTIKSSIHLSIYPKLFIDEVSYSTYFA